MGSRANRTVRAMIEKWRLYNFKSIERADLALSPLTLFAGANSSGKSTFLQSILLVAQTLASRVGSQTVVLNGYLSKLGQFDDVRNAITNSERIRISWDLSRARQTVDFAPYMRGRSAIEAVSCDVTFGVSKRVAGAQTQQLNPKLYESLLSCVAASTTTDAQPVKHTVRLTAKPDASDEENIALQEPTTRPSPWRFDYNIEFDPASLDELRDELSGTHPEGCSLQHFLPQWLVVTFDEKTEIIKVLNRLLVDPLRSRVFNRYLNTDEIQVPKEVVAFLNERRVLLGKADPIAFRDDAELTSLSEVLQWLRGARFPQKGARKSSKLGETELAKDLTTVANNVLQDKRGISTTEIPSIFRDATEYLVTWFSRGVRYLGPLREEPRPMYPLHYTADPQDIGLHGEHTAAVLHNYRHLEIDYISSVAFGTGALSPEFSRVSLGDAVFDWLHYLDVATKVETRDEGKLGYALSVYLDSKVKHDLTHVGVGVSQVLPIVVMCLLASRETTLVLEQPELHLNPKVQTRLGDFFLAMSLLGKQCLIETHSEYLINRLRFRAASADADSLSKLMTLYFVEKQNGLTVYRNVVINRFGAIVDWPQGFFDQSQREVEDILLAATKKAESEG